MKIGYRYEHDDCYCDGCCCGVLTIDLENGLEIDVAAETEQKWRAAYGNWLVAKAEIDEKLQAAEKAQRDEERRRWETTGYGRVLKWFEEHRRKLREDPDYSYPHDTINFEGDDTSYSVSNKL